MAIIPIDSIETTALTLLTEEAAVKNKNPRKPYRITGQKISYYEKKLNIIERKTRLELATPTLARSCSTN